MRPALQILLELMCFGLRKSSCRLGIDRVPNPKAISLDSFACSRVFCSRNRWCITSCLTIGSSNRCVTFTPALIRAKYWGIGWKSLTIRYTAMFACALWWLSRSRCYKANCHLCTLITRPCILEKQRWLNCLRNEFTASFVNTASIVKKPSPRDTEGTIS